MGNHRLPIFYEGNGMPQINDDRIQTSESQLSTISPDLLNTLKEIDERVMAANIWSTITYTLGLISRIDYYSDAAKTVQIMRRDFTRTVGSDQVNYITSILTTSYNSDGSTDSTITTALTRTGDKVTSCASVFATTESPC
jgi:FMN-dependent NADH-azoreductase